MKVKEMFKKKWVVITASVLAVLIIGAVITMCILLPFRKGTESGEFWSPIEPFNITEDAVIFDKEAGDDFKVLNFADIQIAWDREISKNSITYKTMVKTVEEVKPDLITLSGDNVWGVDTVHRLKTLIKVIDSFDIPWAPVYGNHDKEGNCDLNYMAEAYMKAENCIMRKGPENISGVGNYVIAIRENGKIVHTFVMMDSGSGRSYDSLPAEKFTYSKVDPTVRLGMGYDFIDVDQIEWYKWNIKGIAEFNGTTTDKVESTAIFHIPLLQYAIALDEYKAALNDDVEGNEAVYNFTGRFDEKVGSGMYDTGMFAAMKELGSTKTILVGHDHVNDCTIDYQGIKLAYALKTGDCCYWTEDGSMNGGTVMTIGADNVMTMTQHYVRV